MFKKSGCLAGTEDAGDRPGGSVMTSRRKVSLRSRPNCALPPPPSVQPPSVSPRDDLLQRAFQQTPLRSSTAEHFFIPLHVDRAIAHVPRVANLHPLKRPGK